MTDPISGDSNSQIQSFQTSLDSSGSSADQAQFMQQYISMLENIQQSLDDYNSQQTDSQLANVQSTNATNIAVDFNAQAESQQDPSQNGTAQAMAPFDISQIQH